MALEMVDIPIKNGDFPKQTVSLPEGIFLLGFDPTWPKNHNANDFRVQDGFQ